VFLVSSITMLIEGFDEIPEDLIFDFEKILGIDHVSQAQEVNGEVLQQEGQPGDTCKYFLKGTCMKGPNCQFRHTRNDRAVVCKHWLRGLCKKGDMCEFLHEYDLAKMPECYFFSKFGECNNPECLYLHINPDEKANECPWYARGFCKHGLQCRHRHTKKMACENYLAGFCPEGPKCQFGHPKWEIPEHDDRLLPPGAGNFGGGPMKFRSPIICHKCGNVGHKAANCTMQVGGGNTAVEDSDAINLTGTGPNYSQPGTVPRGRGNLRPVDSVTCFKCNQVGHYADKCLNKRAAPPPEGFKIPGTDGSYITIPPYAQHNR